MDRNCPSLDSRGQLLGQLGQLRTASDSWWDFPPCSGRVAARRRCVVCRARVCAHAPMARGGVARVRRCAAVSTRRAQEEGFAVCVRVRTAGDDTALRSRCARPSRWQRRTELAHGAAQRASSHVQRRCGLLRVVAVPGSAAGAAASAPHQLPARRGRSSSRAVSSPARRKRARHEHGARRVQLRAPGRAAGARACVAQRSLNTHVCGAMTAVHAPTPRTARTGCTRSVRPAARP